MFWHTYEVVQNGVIDGNVDITIFDGDATGTTSKELDRNFPETEHKLYPLIGNNPSIIELIRLLINQITVVLNIVSNFIDDLILKINKWYFHLRNNLPLVQ